MRLAKKERAVSRQTANRVRQQSFELFFYLYKLLQINKYRRYKLLIQ